jgi:hypothetical protein
MTWPEPDILQAEIMVIRHYHTSMWFWTSVRFPFRHTAYEGSVTTK